MTDYSPTLIRGREATPADFLRSARLYAPDRTEHQRGHRQSHFLTYFETANESLMAADTLEVMAGLHEEKVPLRKDGRLLWRPFALAQKDLDQLVVRCLDAGIDDQLIRAKLDVPAATINRANSYRAAR